MHIIIRPPFYKSTFAYIFYITGVLVTTLLIIHFVRERTREKIRQKNAIKKIEDEKKIYEAKIDFFTQVAHEIRTPLTLIKGPLEKIIRSEELPLKLEKNVRIMERNTNRLLDLTNDLLNFRESETSRFSLNFKTVNFNKLIEHFISSPLTHINSIAHSKHDEQFLENLNKVIIDNIYNAELDVSHLATLMNMSRPTLYRKIKTISNLTPNEIINLTHLKQAAIIMKREGARINEVYANVGYHSPTHFTRNFQKQFNMSPAEYMKSGKDIS